MSNYWDNRRALARYRIGRRRFVTGSAAASAGLAALGLVGCGDDSSTSTSTTAAGSATPAGAATAGATTTAASTTSQAKKGGTLKMMDFIGSDVYDPAITGHAGSFYGGMAMVYENLNRTSTGFKVEAMLAGLPEQVDQLTLIYKLKPGVKWQNVPPLNGRAFNAQDAAFGLQRFGQSNPEFIFGSRFSAIDKYEAVDASTLKITTKSPFSPLVTNIAEDNTLMVSKEAVDKFGDAGLKQHANMIGTGAFVPAGFDPTAAKVTRNPSYWQAGLPYLDGIDITQITDAAQRQAAFVAGQVDMNAGWGMGTLVADAKTYKDQLGDKMRAEAKQLVGRTTTHFNTLKPPFGDPRVRKALHLATDRDAYDASSGGNYQGMAVIPQVIQPYGFTKDQLSKLPGYRQDKTQDIKDAKALLSAAGKGSGFSFTMVTSPANPLSQIMQQNWKDLGVDVKFQEVTINEWLTARIQGNFEVITAAMTEAADPDQPLYGANHSKGSVNFGKFSDPAIDALCEKQRTIFNTQERKAVTDDLQNKLLELSPQIWTVSYTFQNVIRSYVKDFVVIPGYQGWMFASTWLDK
ncbi:MAG: ABC transporter substrate-binding protein [Dehalococcoidia bacterium]